MTLHFETGSGPAYSRFGSYTTRAKLKKKNEFFARTNYFILRKQELGESEGRRRKDKCSISNFRVIFSRKYGWSKKYVKY